MAQDKVSADMAQDKVSADMAQDKGVSPWFDQHGELLREIPEPCIEQCSAAGSADDAVAYWVRELGFDAPPDMAAKYLKPNGPWDSAELQDHEANMRQILWLACEDIQAYGEFLGIWVKGI